MTSVTIPSSVTSIGDNAFYACHSLTSVTIPSSVTTIGSGAFAFSAALSAITVDVLNAFYSSVDGVFFNKSQTTLIQCPARKNGRYYTIPESVTSIGDYAFANNHNLTSVTIPESVTSIGNMAFAACWLTGVYFYGDAPSAGSNVLWGYGNDGACVYYLPGTTGWGPTFGGRPTALWPPPDFVILSVAGPSAAAPGDTVSVTVSARYQGQPQFQSGSYVLLRMILSPDEEINLDDTHYADALVPMDGWADAPWATVTQTFSYTIPSDASGTFYWGAYVDAGTYWNESDENNNALAGNSVLVSGPLTPIVLIPGTGGSYLCAPNFDCGFIGWPWSVFILPSADPRYLQCDDSGNPRPGASDEMKAAGFLDISYNILDLENYLLSIGYEEGSTLFRFPYDFRRSIPTLANELNRFIENVVLVTHAQKTDLIAHSMGGLVAKQYVATANGTSRVRKLILLGTPNLGAPLSLKTLRYGYNLGANFWGLVDVLDECKVKRAAHNWPSLFNLLPGAGYIAQEGPYVSYSSDNVMERWLDLASTIDFLKNAPEKSDYCPLDPEADPTPISTLSSILVDRDFVQFQGIRDSWQKPANIDVFMIAGCSGNDTVVRIREYSERHRFANPSVSGVAGSTPMVTEGQRVYFDLGPGDGTVPLTSAIAVPAANGIYYVAADHGGMLSNSGAHRQVAGLLAGGPDIYDSAITTSPPGVPAPTKLVVLIMLSPAEMLACDPLGRCTGFQPNGLQVKEIPNSVCLTFGDQKFIVLPDLGEYHLQIVGTGDGTFTLEQDDVDQGTVSRVLRWFAVPVKPGAVGEITISHGAINPVLSVDLNNDKVNDYVSAPDGDGDGIPDYRDKYPDTPLGAAVNNDGGCMAQLVPCAGPATGGKWKNHGDYVSAVAWEANNFLAAGLITEAQKDAIVTAAAMSTCGRRK
ncbi:MAG: alpha/beta fold hydrolase [Verrucomicrobiia bacterium]